MQYATGLALLAYLSPTHSEPGGNEPRSADQGDITAALASCASFSAELASRGLEQNPHHECFLQFAARLVYHHATHGLAYSHRPLSSIDVLLTQTRPFRPVYIREQLGRFVKLFPQNTILLAVFAWARSSLRIDDPVRILLRSLVLARPHDCIASRVFAIRYELQVGNARSVRGGVRGGARAGVPGDSPPVAVLRPVLSRQGGAQAGAKERLLQGCGGLSRVEGLYMEAFITLARDMAGSTCRPCSTPSSPRACVCMSTSSLFASQWEARHSSRTRG